MASPSETSLCSSDGKTSYTCVRTSEEEDHLSRSTKKIKGANVNDDDTMLDNPAGGPQSEDKIEKLTAVLQSLDNQPSTRRVFYAEDREDAKEMQLRTSKVGKVPVFEDVPDQIKSASYRELEARKGRVNDLEKLYMDMAMQKELQKKGRKRKLREDEIVCPISKTVYKWRPDRK
ncbi:hypothetical protein TEA_010673 [Camellia sinensis var. sinensis]|uniref:Uncharacterized protein n=1 Tax=Camellia sinensis var. sinensis TaxID=542762 RepID=A0A4S4E5X7_CAMSN|nr:hypothetical protein TEA_010673 [Camellia sinensis var. sinensis]